LFSYGSRTSPIDAPVVGVVQDVFANGLDRPPSPAAFVLRAEDTPTAALDYMLRGTALLPDQAKLIRRTIMDLNPSAEVSSVVSLRSTLTGTIKHRTFATLLLSIIGLAGGVVALIGLAGIVHFMVRQRTHEIAIRLAIGADRRHIRRLVVREGFIAALTGSVLGLVLGRWLSTGLSSLVFGLEAGNWTTSLAVGASMLVIMTMATLLPARRALRLEPVQALRIE
jgi:putative ABC transport system permease protein